MGDDMQTTEYASLRHKIAVEKAERVARYADFERLVTLANEAGLQAALAITPTAMHVINPNGSLVQTIGEGACGFAWIMVRPANSSFGRWLLKNNIAVKGYNGGAQIWISAHGQSYERKLAHARAMADFFRNAGYEAYACSRLD